MTIKMNIDAESIALLSLVLRDAPQDRQFILCVLARSNQAPGQIKFNSNTEYPTFYGYSNERMPYFLMGKGVLSNVPREGSVKRLISSHYLSYAETVINKAKNWDIPQRLFSVSKFITLDNKTGYKDAEVFLVFRDKAQDYIKDYVNQNQGEISGFLKSKVGRFEFGSQLLEQNERIKEQKGVDLKTRYEQLIREIRTPRPSQSRRGLEKKWDVLQAIWTVYESNSRADAVFVPVARLIIKGRDVEEIDGIIEGLRKEGCFANWRRLERHYDIGDIDHIKLPEIFNQTQETYKRLTEDYQGNVATNLPKSNADDIIECGNLTYSFRTTELKYKKNKYVELSPEKREIKFFITLCKNKNQTVDYKDIAREVGLQSYKDSLGNGEVLHESLQNRDFSEDASLLRRDFRKLVLPLGMSKKEFRDMIKTVTKRGYKLVCHQS